MKPDKMKDLLRNLGKVREKELTTMVQMHKARKKAKNPIVRSLMKIILEDAKNHQRVIELTMKTMMAGISSMPKDDQRRFNRTVALYLKNQTNKIKATNESLQFMKKKKMAIQAYLFKYLLADDIQHRELMSDLRKMKTLFK